MCMCGAQDLQLQYLLVVRHLSQQHQQAAAALDSGSLFPRPTPGAATAVTAASRKSPLSPEYSVRQESATAEDSGAHALAHLTSGLGTNLASEGALPAAQVRAKLE